MTADQTMEVPPLVTIDSIDSSLESESSKSSISNQLTESLEKTRTILKQWRIRPDDYFPYDENLSEDYSRSFSFFPSIHDVDDSFSALRLDKFHNNDSVCLSHPDLRKNHTTMSVFEEHQSSDIYKETAGDSLSSTIMQKREKKNAALSKLQEMLMSISVSQSDDSERLKSSSSLTSYDVAEKKMSSQCSLTFSEGSRTLCDLVESDLRKENTREGKICAMSNARVYDSFIILKL